MCFRPLSRRGHLGRVVDSDVVDRATQGSLDVQRVGADPDGSGGGRLQPHHAVGGPVAVQVVGLEFGGQELRAGGECGLATVAYEPTFATGSGSNEAGHPPQPQTV